MAYREYKDSEGISWKVWNTSPVPGAVFSPTMRDGWLTFECDGDRRRLAPIPRGWERLSTAELERLCKEAQQYPRSTPQRGTAAPDDSMD
jgi:hypothetical protein